MSTPCSHSASLTCQVGQDRRRSHASLGCQLCPAHNLQERLCGHGQRVLPKDGGRKDGACILSCCQSLQPRAAVLACVEASQQTDPAAHSSAEIMLHEACAQKGLHNTMLGPCRAAVERASLPDGHAAVTARLRWLSAACTTLHGTSIIAAGEDKHHCCWPCRMSTPALAVSWSCTAVLFSATHLEEHSCPRYCCVLLASQQLEHCLQPHVSTLALALPSYSAQDFDSLGLLLGRPAILRGTGLQPFHPCTLAYISCNSSARC